ncbi:Protein of unknown function [Pyronema omphalodes CBS 100304]|uniref:Secreted protein n=1 Tax=Pyronema omphalodes (strain CBS 100304) TaxID=1076935 RepID=U4LSP5_PYROM|nr:Protein of unknown function [Pyronema omphalodes CBS 100304]
MVRCSAFSERRLLLLVAFGCSVQTKYVSDVHKQDLLPCLSTLPCHCGQLTVQSKLSCCASEISQSLLAR